MKISLTEEANGSKVKNSLHLSFNKRVLNIHLSMNRKSVMVIVLYFIQQHRTKHSPFESSSYNIVNVSDMFVQEVAVLLIKHLSFSFFSSLWFIKHANWCKFRQLMSLWVTMSYVQIMECSKTFILRSPAFVQKTPVKLRSSHNGSSSKLWSTK